MPTRPSTPAVPETPFSAWFSTSHVVEPDGSPKVVYHGTAVQGTTYDTPRGQLPAGAFTAFDKDRCGSVTESSDAKAGFWFSASERRATDAAAEAKSVGSGSAYVYEVFLSLKNPLVLDNVCDYEPSEVAKLARNAKKAGHDGLLFERGEYVEPDYLVFEPTQIKSVHNSGAFDPVDPDITDRRAAQALKFLSKLGNPKASPRA